jgi:MoxR-like ATPase
MAKKGTVPKAVAIAVNKMQAVQADLNSAFFERQAEVEGILVALIARQHLLFLGRPGTAKSALTRALCESVDGATYFKWLLTKFTTPEEVFGPLSLKGLEQDVYRRVTTKKMPEAHVVFLDECFKANSAILNSLLTVLQEREFDNNGAPIPCPLSSCFGASNELPKDESLEALYDRFVLRYWVERLTDHDSMKAVYTASHEPSINARLDLDDLTALQAHVAKVTVSDDVAETFLQVKRELESIGVEGSDRRWRACLHVVRAYALLRGRTEVRNSDLLILGHCMWREPDQRQQVAEKVGEIASPLVAEALQTMDAAKQAHRELCSVEDTPQFLDKAVDVRADLKEMRTRLQERIDEFGGDCPEASESMAEIRRLQADARRRHDKALD